MTWEPRRLSTLATYHNGRAFRPDDFSDAGLPVIRIQQLMDPSAELDYYDGPHDAKYLIDSGDLVFSWSATLAVQLWNRGPALLNQHLFKVVPFAGVDRRWLAYALYSAVPNMQGLMHGSAMTHITRDVLKQIRVPCPPPEGQPAIADFLDRETARIDALIRKSGQLEELLATRRACVIDDALAPRGDRGGIRLKFLVGKATSGNRDHSFTYSDEGIPCLRGLNVRPGRIDASELLRISEEDHKRHWATQLHTGDVVVVRSGNAGTAAVIPPELEGSNCVDLVIIRRSERANPRLLEYFLNSHTVVTQIDRIKFGAALTHFNAVDVGELTISIPHAIAEQERIVRELDERVSTTDELAERLRKRIALLQEHRKALITAAVSGQLEVSKVA